MAVISVVVSCGNVFGVRQQGVLQPAELAVYDMLSTAVLA